MGNIQSNPQPQQVNKSNPKQVNDYNKSINQFNSIISQSSDALACGPDCQKTRRTEQLKQQYLDAQTNTKYAPVKEENAAKDYYTYTQGTAGYNKYHKDQLTSQANSVVQKTTKSFSEAIDSAKNLTNTYESLYSSYTNAFELYKKYLTENLEIENSINSVSTDRVTNDRKSFYEGQGIDKLNSWHTIFKWIYIILLILFFFRLIFSYSNYRFSTKILLLVLFIIYPFVIEYFFMVLYKGIITIYKFLPENVYTSMR
jgi:hypothetical protein